MDLTQSGNEFKAGGPATAKGPTKKHRTPVSWYEHLMAAGGSPVLVNLC